MKIVKIKVTNWDLFQIKVGYKTYESLMQRKDIYVQESIAKRWLKDGIVTIEKIL